LLGDGISVEIPHEVQVSKRPLHVGQGVLKVPLDIGDVGQVVGGIGVPGEGIDGFPERPRGRGVPAGLEFPQSFLEMLLGRGQAVPGLLEGIGLGPPPERRKDEGQADQDGGERSRSAHVRIIPFLPRLKQQAPCQSAFPRNNGEKPSAGEFSQGPGM
jgi:hypothetical protein